ncbi:hypothetical protein [Phytoactinopolyspora endophytica]|nr:hypothetical protein [Phytoactinopolyspora endophytica]
MAMTMHLPEALDRAARALVEPDGRVVAQDTDRPAGCATLLR